ncbi:MAG TPA: hypothetical protein VLV16_02735 [Gemmatimonadales bacterium]|nr:hypothetical protein [Gemmatimonadales bacterium]
MIARLLLSLLADVVFESVLSKRRSFSSDMNRYLRKRGLAQDRVAHRAPAR